MRRPLLQAASVIAFALAIEPASIGLGAPTTSAVADEAQAKDLRGADLLMSNVYDQLTPQVTDVRDLGNGLVDDAEYNHQESGSTGSGRQAERRTWFGGVCRPCLNCFSAR